MKGIMKELLPGAVLVAGLASAHLLQEKPLDTRAVESNSGRFMIREFNDRYEVHQQGSVGGTIRKMYDYGKDGELDLLGGGPKGLASKVGTSTHINGRHQEIYQEVFSKLE